MIESFEIGKKPLFTEKVYKGIVKTDKESYAFWLIAEESEEHDNPISIRWITKQVPKDVRAMEDSIIVNFKNRV